LIIKGGCKNWGKKIQEKTFRKKFFSYFVGKNVMGKKTEKIFLGNFSRIFHRKKIRNLFLVH